MFYADEAGKPGWFGCTSSSSCDPTTNAGTDALVIRYVVACLAGYFVVVFNSGIDIVEFRNSSLVPFWGNEVQALDPYDHPVSSRQGGGSGEIVFSQESFRSRGDKPARIFDMTIYFQGADIPVSMDDARSEKLANGGFRNFTRHDIR